MCSPILPAAAVYLIHEPTIIRQSPVGPFLAQGDRSRAIKYIIFQGNTYKWRQREARHFPIFDREMWNVVNTLNILLRFKHNRQASTFVSCFISLKDITSNRKVWFCHCICTLILTRIYVKFASWASMMTLCLNKWVFFSSVQQLVALGVAQKLDIPHRRSSELRSSLCF